MEIALQRIAAWKDELLDLSNLGLTELPPLPASLTGLLCDNNKLTKLPDLPPGLTSLWCSQNELTELPMCPATLTYLNCSNNQLTKLPALSAGIRKLDCSTNKLIELPLFPTRLRILKCSNNKLERLPSFPDTIRTIECYNNLLPVYPIHSECKNPTQYEARLRSIIRCRTIMEELMMVCWSPARLHYLVSRYPLQQWNYIVKKYEPLTFITMNEIL